MKREEKKKKTREKIVAAALALFEQNGYEETTVSQITERAGVAKGTFFNYFNSKDDLMCEIKDFFIMEELEKLKDKPGPLLPLLRAALLAIISGISENPGITRAQFECSFKNPALLDGLMDIRRKLFPIFQRMQESGEITRSFPPETLAQIAMQTYMGVLVMWHMEDMREPLQDLMLRAFEIYFDGIRAKA